MEYQKNNIKSTQRAENEIDLLEVLVLIYRRLAALFRWLGAALGAGATYLLRKSLWLALFIALGVVVGVVMDRRIPKIYRSEAIIRSNNLETNIVADHIEKLNNLCRLKGYHELSIQLNISEHEAEKIHSLSAYYGLLTHTDLLRGNVQPLHYAKKYEWDDTSIVVSRFVKVMVKVLDEDVYVNLTPGLLHFISNNTFGYKMNTLRVEQLKSQIAYTEQEISTLQQIQAAYTSKSSSTVQLELSSTLRKSEQVQLHETINKLYASKKELEREYTLFTQPATVITDFSKTYRPTVGLYMNIAKASIAIIIVGLIALLLWENRKKQRSLPKA
ncbi:MAG: hypothetical protein LBT94_07285 [Prevotellaceae bacterium]|jgi:hypothetical protein|nr:hypothetical protein [Prevotellaceae bacterium]